MNILEITLIMDLIGMIQVKKNFTAIPIGMKGMTMSNFDRLKKNKAKDERREDYSSNP